MAAAAVGHVLTYARLRSRSTPSAFGFGEVRTKKEVYTRMGHRTKLQRPRRSFCALFSIWVLALFGVFGFLIFVLLDPQLQSRPKEARLGE